MKRYSTVLILFLLMLALIGCGNTFSQKYQKISDDEGRTTFLDTESISYDKSTDVATYFIKVVYDDKASSIAATKWYGNTTVNPFIGLKHILIAHDMHLGIQKFRSKEANYINKEDKTALRLPNNSAEWFDIKPDSLAEKTYQIVTNTLKNQNKM